MKHTKENAPEWIKQSFGSGFMNAWINGVFDVDQSMIDRLLDAAPKLVKEKEAKPKKDPWMFTCRYCARTFTSPHKDRKYCSNKCSAAARRLIDSEPPEPECIYCDVCGNMIKEGHKYYFDNHLKDCDVWNVITFEDTWSIIERQPYVQRTRRRRPLNEIDDEHLPQRQHFGGFGFFQFSRFGNFTKE